VVIAVIALLMAILIPELKQAREEENALICQSNLHQWGAIFLMYTDDNDGREKQLTAKELIPRLTRMLQIRRNNKYCRRKKCPFIT
jgi:hypothetical protein